MELTILPWGSSPDHQPLELITLSHSSGFAASWTTWGASLVSLKVPGVGGESVEMLLTYDKASDLIQRGRFFGAMVGRWANRVAQGRFPLDGRTVDLTVNNPPHHLHGGRKSWCQRVWKPEPFQESGRSGVIFSLTDPAGTEGYPGTVRVQVKYWLTGEGQLGWEMTATSDEPTIINVVNHAYWNLAGPQSQSILDHDLLLPSRFYYPADSTSLPSDQFQPVENSPYDFRREKALGLDLARTGAGYDHCYVVERSSGTDLDLAAVLRHRPSGRSMEVWTDSPCLQLYTGNFLQGDGGAGGRLHVRHSGICLETQLLPDAPNRGSLPPGHPSPILRPGKEWKFRTVHQFLL